LVRPLELVQDCFQDRFRARQHVIVPEPNDSKALRGEIGAARRIPFLLFGVLATIELDDQMRLDATKVGEVGTHAMLAPKFRAGEPAIAQAVPEDAFCVRGLVTEIAGARA
jgi:hypothetical protein